jgi:mannose-1-phosphate guanylyltransferase
MFVWQVARFLDVLGDLAPATLRAVLAVRGGRQSAWRRAERISVDYAVMEKVKGVKVVALDAGWDDVGSWDAAARLKLQSDRSGWHVLLGSDDSVVFSDERLVAAVGVPGVVVVDTPDALLVLARDRSEEVRAVVRELRRRGRTDLL